MDIVFDRDFKGIWISRDIWLNEELDIIEKCLYAEIDSLCVNGGACFASNEYFAEFFKCSERKISSSISHLLKVGLIVQTGFDGRKRFLQSRVEQIARQGSKICEAHLNNIDNNIEKENSIKESCEIRNGNQVTTSFVANNGNLVHAQSVELGTETPTSTNTNMFVVNNEQNELQQKLDIENKNSDYDEVIDFFNKTYDIYPRKVSKEQAKTTYTHKVYSNDAKLNRLIARRIYVCLQRQIVAWENEHRGKGRDKDFLPHMSTWLNDNFADIPKKDRGKKQ